MLPNTDLCNNLKIQRYVNFRHTSLCKSAINQIKSKTQTENDHFLGDDWSRIQKPHFVNWKWKFSISNCFFLLPKRSARHNYITKIQYISIHFISPYILLSLHSLFLRNGFRDTWSCLLWTIFLHDKPSQATAQKQNKKGALPTFYDSLKQHGEKHRKKKTESVSFTT